MATSSIEGCNSGPHTAVEIPTLSEFHLATLSEQPSSLDFGSTERVSFLKLNVESD